MITKQYVLTLPPRNRGMHLITKKIDELLDGSVSTGLAHLFLQHTSASLCLNENVNPTVRSDAETIPQAEPSSLHY